MIGVITILSILLSLLIPKIFDAIEDSKINSIIKMYDTVKSAVAMHIAKNGKLVDRNGTAITYSKTVDAELVAQGYLSGRIAAKIGIGSTDPNSTYLGIGVIYGQGQRWDLNGDGVIEWSDYNYDRIIKIVISNLPRKIAWKLSQRIDGEALSATDVNSADTKGRVIYSESHGAGDVTTTVYIYVCNY
ncbi:MAG: hypothetical protein ACPMAG_08490 [Limisphaerales bacterium]